MQEKIPGRLACIMTRIYDLQLTTPSGGNISMIGDDGVVWVTPSQVDKGRLTAEDMVRILPDGTFEGRHNPTMEYRFHVEIYRSRPDIRAIVHAHPPGLVALSMSGEIPDFSHIPSLLHLEHPVGFSKYAIPGSEMLGKHVRDSFNSGSQAVFMENHGIITTGKDILEAFWMMENMERMARIYIHASRIGHLKELSLDDRRMAVGFYHQQNPVGGCHGLAGGKENREELAGIIERAHERGLLTAGSGCFSMRTDDGFLITPDGMDLSCPAPEDLVFVAFNDNNGPGKLSQFSLLHEEIYRQHDFVGSICSAHPAGVMAFAVTATPLGTDTIPESHLMLNRIPLVPFRNRYYDPGEVAALINRHSPAVLIENDCITVTGSSPFHVFDRLEVAEFTARSVIYSLPFGQRRVLTREEIDELTRGFL